MRMSPYGSRVVLSEQGDGAGSPSAPFTLSLASGKRIFDLEGKYRFSSYALAFSPDGSSIAYGNYEQFVRIHDATSGKLIAELTPRGCCPIQSVAFSPNGRRIGCNYERWLPFNRSARNFKLGVWIHTRGLHWPYLRLGLAEARRCRGTLEIGRTGW